MDIDKINHLYYRNLKLLKEGKDWYINRNPQNTIDIDQIDIGSLEVDNANTRDYPDFADAYFSAGQWKDGRNLTDDELDILGSEQGDLLYKKAEDTIFSRDYSDYSEDAEDKIPKYAYDLKRAEGEHPQSPITLQQTAQHLQMLELYLRTNVMAALMEGDKNEGKKVLNGLLQHILQPLIKAIQNTKQENEDNEGEKIESIRIDGKNYEGRIVNFSRNSMSSSAWTNFWTFESFKRIPKIRNIELEDATFIRRNEGRSYIKRMVRDPGGNRVLITQDVRYDV